MPHSEAMLASGLTPSRVPADVTDHVGPCFDTVAALGLPDTLVHNDLHTHNAFDHPDGLILFDFADAVLGHPLSGLLVPSDVLAEQLGHPGPHDPRLQRVADAALEVWSDLAPMRELRAALPAALRLGRPGRAESWARVVPDLTGQDAEDFGGAAAAWLARVTEPVPVRFD